MIWKYSAVYILYIILILLDVALITALLAPCFLDKEQATCAASLGKFAMFTLQ